MQRTHLTSKLFIPVLVLSLLTFGFSFDRYVVTLGIGVNTYLVIFVGYLLTIASLLAIRSLANHYPDQSIIYLGNQLLGVIGKIGTPVWLMIIFILTAVLVQRVNDEISTITLFRTPEFISMLAFLLIAGYMALLGAEALGRLSSLVMFILPLLVIILILSFRQVNFLNIHPVSIFQDTGYIKKWDLWLLIFSPVWILCSFYGNETLRNSLKNVILFFTGATLILGATSLAVAGAFGAKGIERYEWPVMSLMNITELAPNYFFQNFITTIYIAVFMSFSLITAAGFLLIVTKGLTEFLGLKNPQSKWILLLVAIALIILLSTTTRIDYKQTANLALKVGSLYTFGYIIMIWFGSLFRRKEQV